jgi:hypothetical protein
MLSHISPYVVHAGVKAAYNWQFCLDVESPDDKMNGRELLVSENTRGPLGHWLCICLIWSGFPFSALGGKEYCVLKWLAVAAYDTWPSRSLLPGTSGSRESLDRHKELGQGVLLCFINLPRLASIYFFLISYPYTTLILLIESEI